MFTRILRMSIKLFFLVFLLFIAGCEMKVDCPEFDNELLQWFPYEAGSSIVLINSNDNTELELKVDNTLIRHTTHYKTNEDCGTCDDRVEINESSDDLNISIFLNENNIEAEYYLI
ncbi:MAG: hypothetical protein HC831_27295, partial [Chloroflexia bacterium]|nr:hypothetical protein [Chloroflexia bacterium]